MKAEQLRKSILQMAIEGKLVAQNSNDEPASILLERIRSEKQKLIKEGKIKKDKYDSVIFKSDDNRHYEKIGSDVRNIDDEIPFDIPESWVWVRLGEIFNIIMGQSPKGESISETQKGLEFHQGKIFFGDYIIKKSNQITLKPTKIAPKDSVLLCVRAPVGKVNITDRELCIGRGLCSIQPLAKMSVNFVFLFLKIYEDIFAKQATGSTFMAITNEIVKNQIIPLPPLAEQERIVSRIKELEPLIAEYDKFEQEESRLNIDLPDRLRKSILQYAIQGKLVPQDPADEPATELLKRIHAEKELLIKSGKIKRDKTDSYIYKGDDNSYYEKLGEKTVCIDNEIPFSVPENWSWVKLKYIASLISGQDLSPSQYNQNISGIPYITGASNFENEQIIINRWTNSPKSIAIKDDLLLTCKGTVGEVAFLCEEQAHIARQVMAIRINKNIAKEYLKFCINTYITKLKANAKSLIPGISREDVLELFIPIPSRNEQTRIIEFVQLVFKKLQTSK